jgi:hypothetical protein
MDDKERIEKLFVKLQASFNRQERVLAIIQTRDESIEALCDCVTIHSGPERKISIRLNSGEMKYKDVLDLYEDRNCYAYIESEPQVVFKFPENPEGMPLGLPIDEEGYVSISVDYEFFLVTP